MKEKDLLIIAPVCIKNGMASAKRLGNLVQFIKTENDVVNLYQSKVNRTYEEEHVTYASYRSFIGELRFLFSAKRKMLSKKNVYYHYGYPSFKNIFNLIIIRLIGYHIYFDIVEDYYTILPYKKGFFKKMNLKVSIWLLKKSYLIASGYIGISAHLCLMLNKLFKDKRQVLYLPISVNPQNFPLVTKEKKADKVSFFYGGSYAPKDDFDVMLHSFINAYKKHPDRISSFRLAGRCSSLKMAEIKAIIKSENLQCINFLGFLTDEEYYDEIALADVLVMPRNNSDFANTGFPFKLGEYMATGNCVISARLQPVVDTIGKNALIYYKPESVESLTDAFINVINEPALLKKYGQTSRAIALEKFDAEKHVLLLNEFIINN